jgi:hypothetical protein
MAGKKNIGRCWAPEVSILIAPFLFSRDFGVGKIPISGDVSHKGKTSRRFYQTKNPSPNPKFLLREEKMITNYILIGLRVSLRSFPPTISIISMPVHFL